MRDQSGCRTLGSTPPRLLSVRWRRRGRPLGGIRMTAELLLSKLDGVRSRGPDAWLARCPAHDDRRPSLSIRELPDGRLLVHDFAGCSVEDVLTALGLDLD